MAPARADLHNSWEFRTRRDCLRRAPRAAVPRVVVAHGAGRRSRMCQRVCRILDGSPGLGAALRPLGALAVPRIQLERFRLHVLLQSCLAFRAVPERLPLRRRRPRAAQGYRCRGGWQQCGALRSAIAAQA